MAHSQNGWLASPNAADIKVKPFLVGAASFSPGTAYHDYNDVVHRYFWTQFNARVEKLRKGWCWGFYYRANRNNPNSLSNHSSATANDGNAPLHPNGVPTSKTFSKRQIDEIHKILAELNSTGVGVVFRWGGDYKGTPDAMHGELVGSTTAVTHVGKMILAGEVKPKGTTIPAQVVTAVTPTPGPRTARKRVTAAAGASVVNLAAIARDAATNQDALDVQRVLNRWYPHADLTEDGVWGDQSYNALNNARVAFGIKTPVSDPAARAATLKRLGFKVNK